MRVTMLGTGTVAPTADRVAPSLWIEAGPCRILMDCGPGSTHRAASYGIPWHDTTHTILTHYHPDHWAELPLFLFALRWGIDPPRTAPLTLMGPRGLRSRLALLAGAFGDAVGNPDYPLDVQEVAPGTAYPLAPEVTLEVCATPHTDTSVAYAVGTPEGRLVYTGDTGPSHALAQFAAGCTLLIAECSLPDDRAIDTHLTPTRVGELAREAGVERVVLTHLYPVFGEEDPAATAAAVYGGSVTVAADGDRFGIGENTTP